MSYLGQAALKNSELKRFDVTSSTSATHVLSWTAPNEQSLFITINGVKQQEDAYSIAGSPTTITLTDALVATDKMEVIGVLDIGVITIVGDNSVSTSALGDTSVTTAKIATDAVTTAKIATGAVGTTEIAANAVTLAEMAGLVRGKLIVGDSSGDPSALTVGTADQVLTSDGTDAAWSTLETGTSWQAVQTAAFTAVAGNGYPCNTTAAAFTITLPASASVGDTIEFIDSHRQWVTNAVTLETNGLNYQGNEDPNPVYDTSGESVRIVYVDATQGWIPVFDGAVALETPQITDIEWLVIAGGGGGGTGQNSGHHRSGGGGGAGGYRNSFASEASGGGNSTETKITGIAAGIVLTATVGAGGAGVTGNTQSTPGTAGVDSSLIGTGVSITSAGGGRGAQDSGSGSPQNGGSGGGAGSGTGTYTGGSGTSNQGYDGGDGYSNTSGGGGGAGGEGQNGDDASAGGAGGIGLDNTITGASVGRGGGGGGGGNTAPGAAATHGGGNGGTGSLAAGAGTANTGGGGGGGGEDNYNAAAGGSGVVILRMLTTRYSGTITGSPTVTTTGLYTIVTFTGTGTYTT